MTGLNLSENLFSGTISLTNLPAALRWLYLGSNSLSGTIDVTRLLSSMMTLHLYRNDFYGSTDFGHLPQSLRYLEVHGTQLSGELPKYTNLLVETPSSVTNCGNAVLGPRFRSG